MVLIVSCEFNLQEQHLPIIRLWYGGCIPEGHYFNTQGIRDLLILYASTRAKSLYWLHLGMGRYIYGNAPFTYIMKAHLGEWLCRPLRVGICNMSILSPMTIKWVYYYTFYGRFDKMIIVLFRWIGLQLWRKRKPRK